MSLKIGPYLIGRINRNLTPLIWEFPNGASPVFGIFTEDYFWGISKAFPKEIVLLPDDKEEEDGAEKLETHPPTSPQYLPKLGWGREADVARLTQQLRLMNLEMQNSIGLHQRLQKQMSKEISSDSQTN